MQLNYPMLGLEVYKFSHVTYYLGYKYLTLLHSCLDNQYLINKHLNSGCAVFDSCTVAMFGSYYEVVAVLK